MTNIVALKTETAPPNAEAIKIAREILAACESGTVQSVFAVVFREGGDYDTLCSGHIDSLKKVGILHRLSFDLLLGSAR